MRYKLRIMIIVGNPNKRPLDNYKVFIKDKMELWGIRGEVSLISNSESAIFKIISENGKKYIARITEESHRSSNEILSEISWQNFLVSKGINCSFPIVNKKNLLYEVIKILNINHTLVFFSWAEGKLLETDSPWQENIFYNIGAFLGNLHLKTKKYQPESTHNKRHSWWETSHIKKIFSLLPQKYHKEAKLGLDWMHSLPKTQETFGLIHADFHAGNFHIDNDLSIVAFDFDDCCYHFFSYDLAIPLFDVVNNLWEWNLAPTKLDSYKKSFFEGYQSYQKVDDIWLKRVSSFVRYRRIELLSWIYYMYLDNDTSGRILRFEEHLSSLILDPPEKYI